MISDILWAIGPYLNIAGLVLDFVGVIVLALEWWTALSAERHEAELRRRQEQLRPHPMMPRPGGPHQPVFDHMRQQRETYQQIARGEASRGMRRGWFMLAMVLIALGFLLQIGGSWPR
ncbi:MAG: hypothetical protein R3D57_05335 [Hyphomicrobiaceae bacterium]